MRKYLNLLQLRLTLPGWVLFVMLAPLGALHANDFYWTGSNSNDWSDSQNWVNSGGIPWNGVPGPTDNVFVIEGSYFSGTTVIDITGSAQANSLTFNVTTPGTQFNATSSSDLTLYGGYTGDPDVDNSGFSGKTYFKSLSTGNIITMNGTDFNKDVIFDNPTGGWSFADDFICLGTVTHLRGSLTFGSGNTVTVQQFRSDNTNTRILDISGSTVNVTYGIDVNGLRSWDLERTTGLTFNAAGSVLNILSNVVNINRNPSMASDGLTYNVVHFHNTDPRANIHGTGNIIPQLILDGPAYFAEDNTIGTLTMAAGKAYTLTEGIALTVTGAWNAMGACDEYIMARTTVSGQTAAVNYTGSTANMDFMIIEDVELVGTTATGTNIINMNPLTSGWPTPTSSGQTFYWFGGDGSWSDLGHWSLTSGGTTPAGCLPGPLDNVVFDFASFNAPGQACTLDVTSAYCHNMSWLGVTNYPEFRSTNGVNYLNIYGSLALDGTGAMNYNYTGNIDFKYNNNLGTYVNGVLTSGQTLLATVTFDGQNGEWQLVDPLNSGNTVLVHAGIFRTMGHNMNLKTFRSKVRNQRTIDLSSSYITVDGSWSLHLRTNPASQDLLLNLIEGTSTIEMTNTHFNQIWDWGEEYYNVILSNAGSSQIVYGANTFNNLTFLGNGSLPYQNTINGTLTFSPGKSYTLSNIQTLTASADLNAIGTCTSYIEIKNGTIKKTSGSNVMVEYVVINDNVADAGGTSLTFFADNSVLNGTFGDWTNSSGTVIPFHFQAVNSENWGDPANWFGTYSGGSFSNPTGCIPGPENDVFFYENSFVGGNDNLVIDELNAYCHSMTWVAGGSAYPTTPIVSSTNPNNELHVYGGMSLLTSVDMDWQFDGQVSFRTNDLTPFSIFSAGQTFLQDVLFFGAVGAQWQLTDDFRTTSGQTMIKVQRGEFYSNGRDIFAGKFYSDGNYDRVVDLTGSGVSSTVELTVSTSGGHSVAWKSSGSNLTLNTSGSLIAMKNVNSGGAATMYAVNGTFHDIHFQTTGLGTINGSGNIYHKAEFDGDGTITGSNSYHILNYKPGTTHLLEENETQSLISFSGNPGVFDATGTIGTGIINVSSALPGTQSNIVNVDGSICIDYVNFTDMHASQPGTGTLAFAGPNSNNIANNSGWVFDDCVIPVLSGCVGEAVDFNTLVNGTTFDWTFGDGQTGTGTPISHVYTAPGTYFAYVVISTFNQGSATEDGRNFQIDIAESCCQAAEDSTYVHKSDTIHTSEIWPDKVYVSSNVYVTGNSELDITNSDVVFASGAGIYLLEQAQIFATNSTFRPCRITDTWAGIDFTDSTSGKLNENVLINAQVGLNMVTDGAVEASNNQFLNNAKGITAGVFVLGALEHVITGNTFIVNRDNPFSDGQVSKDFYSVQLSSGRLQTSVSQNQFIYSSGTSTIDLVYGIHNDGAALSISDNTFTNQSFAYVQIAPSGVCAFENNSVDYNSEALGLFSNAADLVAVTLDASTYPTLIATNEMNLAYNVTDNSIGVYTNSTSNVLIHKNEIAGFERGVQGIATSGLIDHNNISHSEIGVSITESENVGIEDNLIESSSDNGIYISNSLSTIRVHRNTVKNDPAFEAISSGITYTYDIATQHTNVEFIENCVFDTRVAMAMINNSSDFCHTIPWIRGNYLFSYNTGMYVKDMDGNIGTGGTDPGRNSFLSNDAANAFDVAYLTSGPICDQLYLVDNWPLVLSSTILFGGGTVHVLNPGGALHSHSTCGNQDIAPEAVQARIGFLPDLESYLSEQLPVEMNGRNYQLSSGFAEAMEQTESADRLKLAEATLSVLWLNDTEYEAEALLSACDGHLESGEMKWLASLHQAHNGEWSAAKAQLNGVTSAAHQKEEHVFLQQIRLAYLAQQAEISTLTETDREALGRIAAGESDAARVARDLIHLAEGGHPYLYEKTEFVHADVQHEGAGASVDHDVVSIYPNPTTDIVNIRYDLSGYTQLSAVVTDLFGKVLMEQSLTTGITSETMDVSNLAAGMYSITIQSGSEVISTLPLIRQ